MIIAYHLNGDSIKVHIELYQEFLIFSPFLFVFQYDN